MNAGAVELPNADWMRRATFQLLADAWSNPQNAQHFASLRGLYGRAPEAVVQELRREPATAKLVQAIEAVPAKRDRLLARIEADRVEADAVREQFVLRSDPALAPALKAVHSRLAWLNDSKLYADAGDFPNASDSFNQMPALPVVPDPAPVPGAGAWAVRSSAGLITGLSREAAVAMLDAPIAAAWEQGAGASLIDPDSNRVALPPWTVREERTADQHCPTRAAAEKHLRSRLDHGFVAKTLRIELLDREGRCVIERVPGPDGWPVIVTHQAAGARPARAEDRETGLALKEAKAAADAGRP